MGALIKGFVSLIAVLFSLLAHAEPYKGFSAYAAMNRSFPCERFLEISRHATKPAMAVLYNTFGNDAFCIRRFIKRFKDSPHLVEIHFSNETCRRNPRICYRQELYPNLRATAYSKLLEKMDGKTRRKLISRAEKILAITKLGNKNTRFILSTGLEDNYTQKAFKNVYKVLRAHWPYEITRSAGRVTSPAPHITDFVELHADTSVFPDGVPCIWNQDGGFGGATSAGKLFEKYSKCDVLISWTARAQGVDPKMFIPPLKRVFEITGSDIVGHAALMKPRTQVLLAP